MFVTKGCAVLDERPSASSAGAGGSKRKLSDVASSEGDSEDDPPYTVVVNCSADTVAKWKAALEPCGVVFEDRVTAFTTMAVVGTAGDVASVASRLHRYTYTGGLMDAAVAVAPDLTLLFDAQDSGMASAPWRVEPPVEEAPPPPTVVFLPQPPRAVALPALKRTVDGFGLGTMPLGVCYPSERPSATVAAAVIRTACDSKYGCVFDTADTYSRDASDLHYVEALLADVHTSQDLHLVFTKGGMRRSGATKSSWLPVEATKEVFAAAISSSFHALGGKKPLPVWMLHHPTAANLKPALEAVVEARAAGQVLHVGVCNASMDVILEANDLEAVRLVCVENKYSLWHRGAEAAVLPWCVKNGVSFLPYGALGGVGAREGRVNLGDDFPDLLPLAKLKAVSPHALVLAWMRHKWPCIIHITGARCAASVLDARTAAGVRLTPEEFDAIDAMGKV